MAKTYFYSFERDGVEITVEYSVTGYDPGVSSGPAECCYPAEGGEVEIIKAFTEGVPDIDFTDEEESDLCVKIFEAHDFSEEDDYVDYDD